VKSDFLIKFQLDKKDTLKVTNTDLTEDYFLFSIFLGKLFRTDASNHFLSFLKNKFVGETTYNNDIIPLLSFDEIFLHLQQ
jgi:hypothetical protein